MSALSRRELTLGVGAAFASASGHARAAGGSHPPTQDIGLVNGQILDGNGKTYSKLAIRSGVITSLSSVDGLVNARLIDLKGRTVIPGLLNGHVHHSRTGMNPGHEVRDIATAFSIQEIQELISRRARDLPKGRLISCFLGWHYVQLAERRLPNRVELDAAAPEHPLFLAGRAGFTERNEYVLTNRVGHGLFTSLGFKVDEATGLVAAKPDDVHAALVARETPEDRLRGVWDNNAWMLSKGGTTIFDSPRPAPTNEGGYPAIELWRQGQLNLRTLINYAALTPEDVERRAGNLIRLFGDDYLSVGGFGEMIGSIPVDQGDQFEPTARAIAKVRWKLQSHTDTYDQVDFQIAAFQRIDREYSLANLRWQLLHAFQTRPDQLQALKALGVGLDLESERYTDPFERGPGPMYRTVINSGIKWGAGTDGSNFAPNSPWLAMYYMTTGVNIRGVAENTSQTTTRIEALQAWTRGSAYQLFAEDRGALEVGKTADLAVLSHGYLDCTDDQLRRMKSLITIVGGRIVHEGDWPNYSANNLQYKFI